MNTCPYCEAEEQIEIQEVWPELREFQLAFCCELLQNDWLEFSSQQPRKDWTRLFREQAGLAIRAVIPGIDGVLRIDWGLEIKPISRKEAQDFINTHHRHNSQQTGDIFRLSAWNNLDLIAVATVGRPTARANQKYRDDASLLVMEVTRLCVREDSLLPDLHWNACSQLYTAAAKEAKKRKAERIITYILKEEFGTSLLACNWAPLYETKKRQNGWHTPSRPRDPKATPNGIKVCWEKRLQPNIGDLNKEAAKWRREGRKPVFGTAPKNTQMILRATHLNIMDHRRT